MKSWAALAVLLALACSSNESDDRPKPTDSGAGEDAGSDVGLDASPPPKLSAQSFGSFEAWAKPIEDFLAVGEQVQGGNFNARVNELAPTSNRLFIGYGDADYNLGEHVPIEFRCFSSKDDPTPKPLVVDGAGQGATQTTPYQTGEEQIDRYRMLDGTLFQAGIDSIDADELYTQANTDPKGIAGNAYRLDGDGWKKFRSIVGGEHVHDLASFAGAVYAVGSGADTRTEFEAGQIFRYLWRSKDLGVSFETVQRIQHPNPGQGDTRWVTLAATMGTLFVFGYESVFASNTSSIRNASFDGTTLIDLAPTHALAKIFAEDSLALPDGTALVWGVDVASTPARYTALHVKSDGAATPLAALSGSTLIDASLSDTGEILYLVLAGDAYSATPTSWEMRVLVADAKTPDATTELVVFTTDQEPVSIAAFENALFLGIGYGEVRRALAK